MINQKLTRYNSSRSDSKQHIVRQLTGLSPSSINSSEISNLCFDFEGSDKLNDEGVNGLSQQIAAHPNIDQLTLNLGKCKKVANKGLSRLSTAVSGLKKLSTLAMNFQESDEINDKNLANIGLTKALAELPQLNKFGINLSRCSGLTINGLAELSKCIASMRGLHELNVNLAECHVDNKCMQLLNNTILQLPELTDLSINVDNSYVGNSSLETEKPKSFFSCLSGKGEDSNGLGAILGKIANLQKFSLVLSHNQKIMDKGLIGLSKGLVNCKHLQELYLDFSWCDNITEKGLVELFERISHLSLTQFGFSLAGCNNITDHGIEILCETIQRIGKLTHLKLDLSNCKKFTSDGFKLLGEAISTKKGLEVLDLNFSLCHKAVSADSFCAFFKYLEKTLCNLKSVKLDFSHLPKIDDKGMGKLSDFFSSSLASLESVSLSFGQSELITDKGIFSLRHALRHLIKLKSLELIVADLSNFTDRSLILLSDFLKGSKLEILALGLSGCPGVTDKSISMLSKAISHLIKLNSLTLSININSNAITNQSLKDFSIGISDLPELIFLDVAFKNGNKITDEGASELLSKFGFIPYLIHLNLSLEGCANITGKILPCIVNSSKSLFTLARLHANFKNCSKILKSDIENLSTQIAALPHLTNARIEY